MTEGFYGNSSSTGYECVQRMHAVPESRWEEPAYAYLYDAHQTPNEGNSVSVATWTRNYELYHPQKYIATMGLPTVAFARVA